MGSKKHSKKYSSSESSDSSESDSNSEYEKKSSKKKPKYSDSETDTKRKRRDSEERSKTYYEKRDDDKSRSRDKHGEVSSSRDREYRDKYKSNDRDRDNHNKPRYDNRERDNRDRDYNNRRDQRNNRDRQGGSRQNYRRRSRSRSFDHANAKWGKNDESGDKKSAKPANQEKDKPNFGLSGKLTEETNTYKGVVIKYSEPPEARKPRRRWRLYPFKGEKALQTLYIHRESAYLIGRERKVVDLPVDHPSCSKQHAALQYRLVPFTREDGSAGKRVRPYLIDLDSANGTFLNNKKIDPKKYVELFEKDVIKFGFSSREYVLLHENSKDEGLDDDVKQEEEEDVKVKIKKEEV